jgi:methylase of polypeptide subunit release factors
MMLRDLLGGAVRPIGMRLVLRQSRRPYVQDWDGAPLLVLPGVLDPVITKVGAWLAARVAAEVRPGETWVDMGCGTGIVGLALARAGARVTCVDIDPQAVRNTRANAALHGLDVEVVESDLFTALPGRRFDRVAYNVPFWPGEPEGRPFGRAMYAGADFAAIRAFGGAFRAHADEARVVLSERGGDFAGARAALGPATVVDRAVHRGEWLTLFSLV